MAMKVLVACEFSGVVRDAFRKRGHDAWSCDLLPTERPGQHLQTDAIQLLYTGWGSFDVGMWDLLIAHPPCTYLCNSGVRWLYEDGRRVEPRWLKMYEAVHFFNLLYFAPVRRIALENPIMHGHAQQLLEADRAQVIQPWQFGHGETKATCLWLKNLPKLNPTNIVEGRQARIHRMPPSKDRGKLRSITYSGIAEAMAEQWGSL